MFKFTVPSRSICTHHFICCSWNTCGVQHTMYLVDFATWWQLPLMPEGETVCWWESVNLSLSSVCVGGLLLVSTNCKRSVKWCCHLCLENVSMGMTWHHVMSRNNCVAAMVLVPLVLVLVLYHYSHPFHILHLQTYILHHKLHTFIMKYEESRYKLWVFCICKEVCDHLGN